MMTYSAWRNVLFDQMPSDLDARHDVPEVPLEIAIDFIDRALTDVEIHTFKEEKIASAFNVIFNSCLSNYWHCYCQIPDEKRCVIAVGNLRYLYLNYFNRYCTTPYSSFSGQPPQYPNAMTDLCYNFWDRFPLFPTADSRRPILDAVIDLFESLLLVPNEHIVSSIVETLCTWCRVCDQLEIDRVRTLLYDWRANPTTVTSEATTDCIEIINAWVL